MGSLSCMFVQEGWDFVYSDFPPHFFLLSLLYLPLFFYLPLTFPFSSSVVLMYIQASIIVSFFLPFKLQHVISPTNYCNSRYLSVILYKGEQSEIIECLSDGAQHIHSISKTIHLLPNRSLSTEFLEHKFMS